MKIPAAKICFPEEDRQQILQSISEILESGQLTLGKHGRQFERAFAEYVGTQYAIAVNSGTSALEIILRALNIKGSSVVVPTNTFIATPAAVLHAGGDVLFADVDDSLCLSLKNLKTVLRDDTRAIMLVHIGGAIAPQTEEIRQFCADQGLYLIEDAAHAHGSSLNGKMAGAFGIAAGFSFYPTKVMTSAEGGMITTDDESIYKRALILRDQGKAGFLGNIHTDIGYNWRMSEVHAAIGLSQFNRLEEFVMSRRNAARAYDRGLAHVKGLSVVPIPPKSSSNYYKYVALLDEGFDRAAIKSELRDGFDISLSGEVYELPCHLQPIFRKTHGFLGGEFPVAEELCQRHICLPIFATMKDQEVDYVVSALKEVLS